MGNIGAKRIHECFPACNEKCDKEHGAVKGETNPKAWTESLKCAKKCYEDECGYDSVEIKILEKYISKGK